MPDRNLDHLHPLLEPFCKQLLAECAAAGINAMVTFTWRSPDEQNALYAKGRTTSGPIVTNATSDKSKHCYTINGSPAAKAFDIAIKNDAGEIITDGSDSHYHRVGAMGKILGLTWGGDFRNLKDSGHFEII